MSGALAGPSGRPAGGDRRPARARQLVRGEGHRRRHRAADYVALNGEHAFGDPETVVVEVQVAAALPPAQVLHECLARAQRLWARDAIDVVAAAAEAATVLAEAASTFAADDLEHLTCYWDTTTGARAIQMEAERLLHPDSTIAAARIAPDAVAAAFGHRYRRILVEKTRDAIVIRRTTSAGPVADVASAAAAFGQALRRTGLALHLERSEPVTCAELFGAIRRHGTAAPAPWSATPQTTAASSRSG